MRPVLRTVLGVLVAAVALIAGFTGGWYAHGSPSGPGSSSLAILGAGSVAPILPTLASAFALQTPGVATPLSAQLYEGSLAAANSLKLGNQPYDLFVSSDFRVIPQHLEPPGGSVATWEAVYASDPIVLAYDPGNPALAGINSSNWYRQIVDPGVVLGVPNASADPLGYAVLFTLELEDHAAGEEGTLYGCFFHGAMGALATPTSRTLYVSEDVAKTALETGEVGAFLTYQSYAVAGDLAYVPLATEVNLGGTSPSDVAGYSDASTTILSSSGTERVTGAPILFALTVPATAPQYALGVAFASYLLSNATTSLWAADGFVPVAPAWVDHPSSIPAALAGSAPRGLPALPAYLAALLE